MSWLTQCKQKLRTQGGTILGAVLVTVAVAVVAILPPLWIPATIVGAVGVGMVVTARVRAYAEQQKRKISTESVNSSTTSSASHAPVSLEVEQVLTQIQTFKARFAIAAIKPPEQGVPELLGLPPHAAVSDCLKACRELLRYWNADKNDGIKTLYARPMGDPDRAAVHRIITFVRALYTELKAARNQNLSLDHLKSWSMERLTQATTDTESDVDWEAEMQRYDEMEARIARVQVGYTELIEAYKVDIADSERLLGLSNAIEVPQHLIMAPSQDTHVVTWERSVASEHVARARQQRIDNQLAVVNQQHVITRQLRHKMKTLTVAIQAETAAIQEERAMFAKRANQAEARVKQAEIKINQAEIKINQAEIKTARFAKENAALRAQIAQLKAQQGQPSSATQDQPPTRSWTSFFFRTPPTEAPAEAKPAAESGLS